MNLKIKLTLITILFFNIVLFGQNETVLTGTVTSASDGIPVPGVNVIVAGTTNGTTTDFDGGYQIKVKKNDVLQFSYIGFVSQTVIIDGQTTLNILLTEDLAQLDEVVVIGYGTQKKSHLTGSISKVVNEDLENIAVARVDDALVGQVSGVNISATDGAAGSAPTIRIRGTGSISSDSGPLVVIDGLVMDSDILGSLDMNDIESFEVLKDAASAAIYGSRAGNGVIMITTKSGKDGDTKFSFNSYTGIKSARHSDDYTLTVADAVQKSLDETGGISDKLRYAQLIGHDTDWQDVIFDGGIISSYSLGVRGGNSKTKFSSAINYVEDEGVMLTDNYRKIGLKLKVDSKLSDKLGYGVSITPTYTNTRRMDGSTHDLLRQASWLPLYHDANTIQYVNRVQDNGDWADVQIGDYARMAHFDGYDLDAGAPADSGGTNIGWTSNTNPGAKVLERERRDIKYKIFSSAYLKYDITDHLSFRTTLSNSYQTTKRTRWQGVLADRRGASRAQSDFQNTVVNRMVTDNYFSYNNTFGDKHDFSFILGYNAEKEKGTYAAIRGTGYDSDDVQTINNASTIAAANNLEWEQSLQSFFSRVTYAYDNRYLASFSIRRDGSSVFGSEYKFGNFPAASVGWNVSNEQFLQNSNFISNLKLRMSYGVTGNNKLSLGGFNVLDSNALQNYYPSLALLGSVNYDGTPGFNSINIANDELKWERSIEYNPGLDYGFFNGIISGSVDYYVRRSDQLLLNNPISVTTGFSEALVNIGEVENSGVELEVRGKIISNENFSWKAAMLSSWNKNTLIDFADSNGQILNWDSKRPSEWVNLEGNPISSFYGFVVDEEIPQEYIVDPYYPMGVKAKDVYVKDLNGDGLIDDDDKTILGDPYPDLIWSFSNDFKINNFDLSFMLQGSHGAQVRNMGGQYIFNYFDSTSAADFIASTPDQQFIKRRIFTNSIVEDASYVALRNLMVGYTFSDDVVDKLKMQNIRLYATGSNLMYFTADGYTGLNPESIDNTTSTTYGYQRGGSPVYSTISLGVSLDF